MRNVTEATEVKTAVIPLVAYMPVEIDTTGIDMNDPKAVLEAAKRQLPHVFRNSAEWRLDEVSDYQIG